jgi:FkbM family methyltransferase
MIHEILQSLLNLTSIKLRRKIKNIPVLKQIQFLIVKYVLRDKEFDAKITEGPAKGLVFPVKLPQDKQMWIGTWELEFAEELRRRITKGSVCYDIGGYKGYYSGVMALGGASEVLVFEPVPKNAQKIKRLIDLNTALPITLFEKAISDKVESAVFKIMEEETMGKLSSSGFQTDENSITEFIVDCVTIDSLIEKGIKVPDFIKIDVEGAEELVLKGALKMLMEYKPTLMIEIHSREIGERCQEILSSIYANIKVFETGLPPQNGELEICHYLVS